MSLHARDVAFSFSGASAPLFESVNLSVTGRAALVGDNGSGKSTLLSILVGDRAPTRGVVERGRVHFVSQRAARGMRVADAFPDPEVLRAMTRLDDGRGSVEDASLVAERWREVDHARASLERLSLDVSFERPLASLSGGQALKVRLAGVARHRSTLVVLDEPERHLDASGRAWLERFVAETPHLLIVSHDARTLDGVDVVYELSQGTARRHGDGFAAFLEARHARRAAAEAALARATHDVRASKRVAVERAERQARSDARGRRQRRSGSQPATVLNVNRARAERSSARVRRLNDVDGERASAAQRDARAALDQTSAWAFRGALAVHPARKTLVHLEGFKVHAGDLAVVDASELSLRGNSRCALVGDNGSGKSTLLRALAGQAQAPDLHVEGRVSVSASRARYIAQGLALDDDKSALANLRARWPRVPVGALRERLADVRLTKADIERPCSGLSGGERVRLAFLKALLDDEADLLLLDEPGNHLDLNAKETLLRALNALDGPMLIASHDRALLDALNINVWLRFTRGRPIEVLSARP